MNDLLKDAPLSKETQLRDALTRLSGKDREFAASLLDQLGRKGSLSDRQWPWVDTLIERAKPKPAPVAEVVNLTKLVALFDKAAEALQRPKVAFACSAGEFIVTRASSYSANPGFLYLKTVSKEYPDLLRQEGELFVARHAEEDHGVIFGALQAFADDPTGTAAAYGKATGRCCFCGRGLEDTRSVEVGYGPVCAKRFGLAWG